MNNDLDIYYYKKELEGLPEKTILILAKRNTWRIFILGYKSFFYQKNTKDTIKLLNSLLASSNYLNSIARNIITGVSIVESRVNEELSSFISSFKHNLCKTQSPLSYLSTVFSYGFEQVDYLTDYTKIANSISILGKGVLDYNIPSYRKRNRTVTTAVQIANNLISLSETPFFSRHQLLELVYKDLKDASTEDFQVTNPIFDDFNKSNLLNEFVNRIKLIDNKYDFYVPFIKRRINEEYIVKEDIRLNDSFQSVSKEKYSQGNDALFQFILDQYYGRLSKKVNIARVMFIGPGGSGKTSLIKALNGKEIIVGKEKPTAGIATSSWSWGQKCDIDIRLWDFAGQVTTHSMHKFFLRERCLYVLMLTTRDDQELEMQAEYWLEHVRLYGNNSPVIIVANKIDEDEGVVNFNEQALIEKYPSIIGFKKIAVSKANSKEKVNSTTYKALFNDFKVFFIDAIKEVVGKYKNELTTEENNIKEALFQINKKDFITGDDFTSLCKENWIENKRINTLKDFFNKLGIFVYFPDLNDDLLLNPRWLSYGVYEVLRQAEKSSKKGWILKNNIREHLAKGIHLKDTKLNYSTEKVNTLIIESIIKFKLGYSITHKGDDYLVMPSVLDKKQPRHGFDKTNSVLHFIYDFDVFLPPYYLHAFVSKSSSEIINDWVWQSGVIIRDKTNRVTALIENFSQRKIDIYLKANQEVSRRSVTAFLKEIMDRFSDIIQDENNSAYSKYSELIEIPESYFLDKSNSDKKENRIIRYSILQDAYNENEHFCRTGYGKFSVDKFYGDYYMENNKEGTTINVAGDYYNTGGDIIKGDQLKIEGNMVLNYNDSIKTLLPLLKEFIQVASENKESRKEIKEIRNFFNELENHPDEIEASDIEIVKNKLKDSSVIDRIAKYSGAASSIILLIEKILPYIEGLLNKINN